jgi:hypothetical protein
MAKAGETSAMNIINVSISGFSTFLIFLNIPFFCLLLLPETGKLLPIY